MNYTREEIIAAAQFVEIDEKQIKSLFKQMDTLKIKRKKRKAASYGNNFNVTAPELFTK